MTLSVWPRYLGREKLVSNENAAILLELAHARFALLSLSFTTKVELEDDDQAEAFFARLGEQIDQRHRPLVYDLTRLVALGRLGEGKLTARINQLEERLRQDSPC